MMNFKDILKKYRTPSKKGFSLVELIVVVAIVSIVSGATLTVFLMVQEVTRDASNLTVDQYNVTQMERLLRNELQVASNIDITQSTTFKKVGGTYSSYDVQENDEYMIYDGVAGRVSFMRADKNKDYKAVFSISDVDSVQLSISPLDDSGATVKGQPYKLFYKVSTSKYDYTGGMVLANTSIDGKDDKSMAMAKPVFGTTKTIEWEKAQIPAGTSDSEANNIAYNTKDNAYVICFHRDYTEVTSSTP